MNPLGPVFDKIEWKIIRADKSLNLARGFTNNVTVRPCDGDSWTRPIVIPTEFYSYMTAQNHLLNHGVRMMLTQRADRTWEFGYFVSSRYNWLWSYKDLPAWAD